MPMPVATELQPLLELLEATERPMSEVEPEELRAQYDQLTSMQLREPKPLAGVVDRTVPGPAGGVPVRVYTPEGEGPFPVVAYLHGGGWVIGSLDTHDGTCRELSHRSGCVVVSVDYRLAPEHRYPAALDDCVAVVRWLGQHPEEVGGDGRMAVAGDSAGGNLAAATALVLRDDGGPGLALQVLVYPVIDAACDTDSYTENATGGFLSAESMHWFWGHYLTDPTLGAEPTASPIRHRDLSGLPPALVVTAEYDPLRDEGNAYGAALLRAGTEATVLEYDGMVHGFFSFLGVTPRADEAHAAVAAALQDAFGLA
jgi:acetyl esterase